MNDALQLANQNARYISYKHKLDNDAIYSFIEIKNDKKKTSSTKQLQTLQASTYLFDLDQNFTRYSQVLLFGVFYNNKLTLEMRKEYSS